MCGPTEHFAPSFDDEDFKYLFPLSDIYSDPQPYCISLYDYIFYFLLSPEMIGDYSLKPWRPDIWESLFVLDPKSMSYSTEEDYTSQKKQLFESHQSKSHLVQLLV